MSFSEDPTQGAGRTTSGEDPTGTGGPHATMDPTLGAEAGGQPYDDPAQGAEVGEQDYEDPTQGTERGSRPGEDPTG
jgi:hypothetical protein